MKDRRPKTHAKQMHFNYMFDRLKQLEWDIHHPVAMDCAIPREWHNIAAHTPRSEKERITLRVETRVLRFFRSLGPGYQVKMNEVLASFVEAKLAGILREEGDIMEFFERSETQERTRLGYNDELLNEAFPDRTW